MVNIARLNLLADELRSLSNASQLALLADELRRQDKMDQAERAARDCLTVARGLADTQCEGVGCLSVGLVYHASECFDSAIRAYEEARDSLHLEADSRGEALALIALGLAHHDRCLADSTDGWSPVFVHFKQGLNLLEQLTKQTRLSKQFLDAETYEKTLERFQSMQTDVFKEYVAHLPNSSQPTAVSPPSQPTAQRKAPAPPKELTVRAFPVYDRVAAGRNFTLVGQPIDGYIELHEVEIDGVAYQPIRVEKREFGVKRLEAESPHFGLRVKGESMINIGIETGDVVLVRGRGDLRDGQVAAVRIVDEATLKRVFQELGYLRLKPENDAEPTIILTPDPRMEPRLRQTYPEADGYEIIVESDVEILGVVVAIFKPLQ